MSNCSICLLPIEGEGETTTCNHTFHLNCVNHWKSQCPNKSCPICRTPQPNLDGELITYWDNISWKRKFYKYGNIEKMWYRAGYLKYDFVLKIGDENTILRSSIYSEDGTGKYTHLDFTPHELQQIRTGGDIEIPSSFQAFEFLYNENIVVNDIINTIGYIYPEVQVPTGPSAQVPSAHGDNQYIEEVN
jgi:hypothetical protein